MRDKYPNSIKHDRVGCNYTTIWCIDEEHEKCTQCWCDCECHEEGK